MTKMANNEKSIFLRDMGIQILDILREAHKLCVTHNDVRCPNILVIPPSGVIKQIADKPFNIHSITSSWDFRSYKFLLNDWGEAKCHKSKTSPKYKDAVIDDLRGVVEAICKSNCIVSSVTPKKKLAEKSMAIYPIYSNEIFKNLYFVASTKNIESLQDELINLFQ